MKSIIPCILAGLLVTAAYADEEQTARIDEPTTAAVPPAQPESDAGKTAPAAGPAVAIEADLGQPLAEADLDLYHGGASTVTNNQTLTATSSHNVLNGDYVAGSVILSDEALSNFDGFGNFAINTGAQVNIQSAMSVTINVGE